MLKELSSVQAYLPFIHAMLADPDFCDPMLATPAQLHQHLLDAHEDPAKRLFGTFDGGTLTGLFSVLVLPEEGYLQLLAGLSRKAAAYDALLSHLQAAYPGYQADFVYSPRSRLLHTALADRHAAFDPEQQKMVLCSPPPYVPDSRVQLYTPAFRAQYLALHDDDRYWTGERVLAAQDTFRVLLAIEDGAVAGYLDLTYRNAENEPYDLFVREKSRRRGLGRALLSCAIEKNRPNAMSLLVDSDNLAARRLYASRLRGKARGKQHHGAFEAVKTRPLLSAAASFIFYFAVPRYAALTSSLAASSAPGPRMRMEPVCMT